MAKFSERDRVRLSWFVEEMIAQRAKRGWSQADLATAATYSKSLVAQVETYERAPTEQLAKALDRAFELPGTFLRLYKKIRGGAFPAAFGEFAEYEATAETLLIFEHSYIPGQFQTEAYIRAVLEHHPNVTPDVVTERAKARLERQPVVTRKEPPPPVLWIALGEQVLDHEIGGPAVMADQLARLAEAADLPNVTILIIPRSFGAHPGMQASPSRSARHWNLYRRSRSDGQHKRRVAQEHSQRYQRRRMRRGRRRPRHGRRPRHQASPPRRRPNDP